MTKLNFFDNDEEVLINCQLSELLTNAGYSTVCIGGCNACYVKQELTLYYAAELTKVQETIPPGPAQQQERV
jgi:hypothetical protein